jgi:hypothetical protein
LSINLSIAALVHSKLLLYRPDVGLCLDWHETIKPRGFEMTKNLAKSAYGFQRRAASYKEETCDSDMPTP